MTTGADERIDRLYSLPLEDFTAERNALAAELRREGDRAGADAVKRLRKPSAAAWAVNQLVRAEPDLVEALLGAGGELRQAHRQAASGRGAAQLRAAAEAERAAVDGLMARAAAVLGRAPSTALAEAMRNTLHAASSDDAARELVASGTLTLELRPVGLGPMPGGAQPAADAARGSARKGSAKRGRSQSRRSSAGAVAARAAEREAHAEEREARARAAERAREVKAAAAAEAALRRELDAAERAVARAEESYARAREAAEAAGERVKEARRRLREARAGLREASGRRARLERD